MATNAINGINGATFTPAAAPAAAPGTSRLGREEFLQLLLTQLKNQDPLDPVKDAEFVAQMAQLSTLEGIEKLNTNFQSFLLLQGLSQGASLIGKTVSYEKAGSEEPLRGQVSAVNVKDGAVELLVGGQAVPLNLVRGVEAGA